MILKNTLRLFILVSAILSLCCPVTLLAQQEQREVVPGTRITTLITGNKMLDSTIISVFKRNAPVLFNTPGLPRFAIVGNDNKFYFGVGGTIRTTLSYDFKNPIDNAMYFKTSEIPMDNPRANNGATQLGVGGSSLFFNFVALPGSRHQVGAYVNFNFENPDHGFCLQYAYVTYEGFLGGYTYTAFCDEAAVPPTIDMEGPPTLPLIQNVALRYTFNLNNWSLGAAVEAPTIDATFDDHTASLSQKYPIVPAFVQYSWRGGESSVRASAVFRNLNYLNRINGASEVSTGWGAQLSGKITSSFNLTTYYQGVYGKGISCMIQDLCGGGLDFVPDSGKEGAIKPVKLAGGMLGLQYDFSEKVFCSATYSHVRCYFSDYEEAQVPWREQIRYLQYFNTNLFWRLSKNTQLGAEYIHGRKVIMDNQRKSNNRIQVLVQFDF